MESDGGPEKVITTTGMEIRYFGAGQTWYKKIFVLQNIYLVPRRYLRVVNDSIKCTTFWLTRNHVNINIINNSKNLSHSPERHSLILTKRVSNLRTQTIAGTTRITLYTVPQHERICRWRLSQH